MGWHQKGSKHVKKGWVNHPFWVVFRSKSVKMAKFKAWRAKHRPKWLKCAKIGYFGTFYTKMGDLAISYRILLGPKRV